MKTVSIRIPEEKAKRLQEVVGFLPGKNNSINGLAERGVDLFLELEAPVWEAAFREAQKKLKGK